MPEHTLTPADQLIVRCTNARAVADVVAAHPVGQVAVVAVAAVPGLDAPRAWWPLLDQCSDRRVADVVADHLTRDLPPSLMHLTPEAATLLAGALHAASLVGWPTITLTHILDSGAAATIVELLTGQSDDFAQDVAAVAGPANPDSARVVAAASVGAQQLHHSAGLITGPAAADLGSVLVGTQAPVVAVHDDGSTVAELVLSRLRFVGSPIITGSEEVA